MNTSTYISAVVLNNKVTVVVSESVDIHTNAVCKLLFAGGMELTHEIFNHPLNQIVQ